MNILLKCIEQIVIHWYSLTIDREAYTQLMCRAVDVSYYSRVLLGAPTHRPKWMLLVGIVIVIVIYIEYRSSM